MQELHPGSGIHPGFASEFSEICNAKVLAIAKYKVTLSILTVISYDSVVLTLIAENLKKVFFQNIYCKHHRKIPKSKLIDMTVNFIRFIWS